MEWKLSKEALWKVFFLLFFNKPDALTCWRILWDPGWIENRRFDEEMRAERLFSSCHLLYSYILYIHIYVYIDHYSIESSQRWWWLLLSTLTCTASLTNHPWHRRLRKWLHRRAPLQTNRVRAGTAKDATRHRGGGGGGGGGGCLASMHGVCEKFRVRVIWTSPTSTHSRVP